MGAQAEGDRGVILGASHHEVPGLPGDIQARWVLQFRAQLEAQYPPAPPHSTYY